MKFGGHKLNEQRTRSWFAFLPVTINGETRWLERVYVVQEWYAPKGNWNWYNIKFKYIN